MYLRSWDMKLKYEILGKYISLVDERNSDGKWDEKFEGGG